ncbi:hypothetical protein DW733_11150 [Ruminococcus sp. AM28-13]|nr:hypothetical protein DW733_11150 [Ruminococcus sp. AM28-13]
MITKKAMTGNARHGEHQTPPSVSYLWAGAKKSATINDSGSGAGASPCWQRTVILIETIKGGATSVQRGVHF